jgi:general secretion pathway protein E
VLAVAAQRLVRVLCTDCREAFAPDEAAMSSIGITEEMLGGRRLYRAAGCDQCFHTGYRGRISIFEILRMDSSLKKMVLETYDSNLIAQEALRQGMTTLRMNGIEKILKGITSIAEVLRVTQR